MNVTVSEKFRAAFPGAHLGVLAMTGLKNPMKHPLFDPRKAEVEEDLREKYGAVDRAALLELPAPKAYEEHFRKYDRSFHLVAQLEALAVNGRPLPIVSAIFAATFMAQLQSLLLTVAHDLDTLAEPVSLDVATGSETYLGIRGREETCKEGDMIVADGSGVISSVLQGPDRRTRIVETTRNGLFTTYAPAGIEPDAVKRHLRLLEKHLRIVAPRAVTVTCEVI